MTGGKKPSLKPHACTSTQNSAYCCWKLLGKCSHVRPHLLITVQGCDFTVWLVLYCNEVKFSVEALKFNGVALEAEERSKVTKTGPRSDSRGRDLGTVNTTRLTSNIVSKTGNLHWHASFAAGLNKSSLLRKNLMLPIQRQDTLTIGSVPLEVTKIMVFINFTGVLVQSNSRKQNLTSLLGGAHFHQLLQLALIIWNSYHHQHCAFSSCLGSNSGQLFYCTFHWALSKHLYAWDQQFHHFLPR